MTAIAALRDNGVVFMGADALGASGTKCTIRRDAKVFCVGPFVIGFTTSFRMGQMLRFGVGSITLSGLQPTGDKLRFMVTKFVPKMRAMFKAAGYMSIVNERESGGEFLVAFGDKLFSVESDFQVCESANRYMACGCGKDIVLGSLYSTEGDPEGRIQLALQAAERHSTSVRRPFRILHT